MKYRSENKEEPGSFLTQFQAKPAKEKTTICPPCFLLLKLYQGHSILLETRAQKTAEFRARWVTSHLQIYNPTSFGSLRAEDSHECKASLNQSQKKKKKDPAWD